MGLVNGCRGSWTGDDERPGPCQCSFCSGERLNSPQNHDWDVPDREPIPEEKKRGFLDKLRSFLENPIARMLEIAGRALIAERAKARSKRKGEYP